MDKWYTEKMIKKGVPIEAIEMMKIFSWVTK